MRTSFLVTAGLAAAVRRETGLAEDFAAGLPLAACPLLRLRAAAGLDLCKPLAPFVREPFCLPWPFPFPFFAVLCAQRAGAAWRELPFERAPLLRDVPRATRPFEEVDAGLRLRVWAGLRLKCGRAVEGFFSSASAAIWGAISAGLRVGIRAGAGAAAGATCNIGADGSCASNSRS